MSYLNHAPEDHTMTNPRMSVLQLLDKTEAGADPEFLRDGLKLLVPAHSRLRRRTGLPRPPGVHRRRDRKADGTDELWRHARLPAPEPDLPDRVGGENGSAAPQPQGLGPDRRARPRGSFRQGERRPRPRLAVLGEVHAWHQGVDGQELHRQPLRGSA